MAVFRCIVSRDTKSPQERATGSYDPSLTNLQISARTGPSTPEAAKISVLGRDNETSRKGCMGAVEGLPKGLGDDSTDTLTHAVRSRFLVRPHQGPNVETWRRKGPDEL